MYTIGIKRRFLPGYKRYQVTAHSWADLRFVLNLVDGSQLIIPGMTCSALKVYDDFFKHLHQIKASKQAFHDNAQATAEHVEQHRQLVQAQGPSIANEQPVTPSDPPDHVSEEAKRRAAARVGRILQGQEFAGQVGAGPEPQRFVHQPGGAAN